MKIDEFKLSLKKSTPPENINPLLLALWFDANNEWNKAHEAAQDIATKDGSWIHAYLHRKEGDLLNASYWYSRAGREMPSVPLETEWENILSELISK
jgi:hypothetical protein